MFNTKARILLAGRHQEMEGEAAPTRPGIGAEPQSFEEECDLLPTLTGILNNSSGRELRALHILKQGLSYRVLAEGLPERAVKTG